MYLPGTSVSVHESCKSPLRTSVHVLYMYSEVIEIVDYCALFLFVLPPSLALGYRRSTSIQKYVGEILQRSNSYCVSVHLTVQL